MKRSYLLLFIVFISLLLISCSSNEIKSGYFRYSLGEIKIENPVLVVLNYRNDGYGGEYGEESFVCPDTTIKYCNDSNFSLRSDVFPYMFIILDESHLSDRFGLLYCFYTQQRHKARQYDRIYEPFYKYKVVKNKNGSDSISFYKFYFNVDRFDAYMQATNVTWYDISDPNGEDPWADDFCTFRYSNTYKLAVRQHYSFFQILKLRLRFFNNKIFRGVTWFYS